MCETNWFGSSMMRDLGLALSVSVLVAMPAFPADGDVPELWSWSNLQIRQSFQSDHLRAEPLNIGFTNARDADDTFAISGALGYEFGTANATISPFVEYQRNSDQKEEQNLIRAGLAANWTWFDVVTKCAHKDDRDAATGRIPLRCWSPVVDLSVKFKQDEVKNSDGLQVEALWTVKGARGWCRPASERPSVGSPVPSCFQPNDVTPVSLESGGEKIKLFFFGWEPQLGFEYEGVYDVDGMSPISTGRVFRAAARLKLTFELFPDVWDSVPIVEGVELAGEGQVRVDLSDSVGYAQGPVYPYGKVSLNFNVYEKREEDQVKQNAAFGFDFIEGEDPSEGFDDQRLLRASFKLKY